MCIELCLEVVVPFARIIRVCDVSFSSFSYPMQNSSVVWRLAGESLILCRLLRSILRYIRDYGATLKTRLPRTVSELNYSSKFHPHRVGDLSRFVC